jgi:O-antigen ligase
MWLFFLISFASCVAFGGIYAAHHRHIANLINFAIIPAFLFYIARRITFDLDAFLYLMRFFKVVGLYLGITGILEHYSVEALIFPSYIMDPYVGLHFGRSRGPFGNSVVMGGALCLIFFWVLWEQIHVKRSPLNLVVLAVTLISIYFTDTRSAWLMFATSVAVLAIITKQLRKPCLAVATVLLVVYVSGVASKFSIYQPTLFSRRQGPVDDRKNIIHASYLMFQDRPILGFGYGNFLKYSPPYFKEMEGVALRGEGEGQHNTLLGLLSELGLVGTIPFCCIYYFFLKVSYQKCRGFLRANRVEKEIAGTQLALLVGLLVYMQCSDIRFFNIVNCIVFWMAGAVCFTSKPVNKETKPAVPKEAELAAPDSAYSLRRTPERIGGSAFLRT